MPLAETVGLGATIYGGLQTIFGRDPDPYEEIRKMQRKLLAKSKAIPGRIKGQALTTQAAFARDIEDRAAAAGTPRNVAAQQISENQANISQQLIDALFQEEQDALTRESQIISAIPPKPVDTSGEDLLGLGIQLLTLGSGKKTPDAAPATNENLAFPIKAPAPINRITPPNPLGINTPGGFGRTPAIGPGFRPQQKQFKFGKLGGAFTFNNQKPNLNGFR